jgi:hypothetical protein
VDPLSGEELLEHPPPEFHYYDVRPLEPPASLLKITPHRDVITVGEKDYIREVDDDEEGVTEIPTDDLVDRA